MLAVDLGKFKSMFVQSLRFDIPQAAILTKYASVLHHVDEMLQIGVNCDGPFGYGKF